MTDNRNCQNCKKEFTIESEDFLFYEKHKVPAPTFCPMCRMQRRMLFRNERTLYRRECGLCNKMVVSIFAPDKPYTVYCPSCWYGDKWDALEYGMEYDPSRPFFEQLKELLIRTPQVARIIDYTTVINSEFVNHAGACKNCTLIFNANFCEHVLYAASINHSKDTMDCCGGANLTLCYEITDGENSSNCFFGKSIVSCVDTIFSRDCTGCINCFGCTNLRNKSYCAFNKQLTPSQYKELIDSYHLDTYTGVQKAIEDSEAFFLTQPKRYMYGLKNQNVIGNYVYHSKNAKWCWCGQFYEDCAYCQFCSLPNTRDTYDLTEWGYNVESTIDAITVGEGASGVRYSFGAWNSVKNIEYSICCLSGASDCFGCTGVRRKQYCILNKQYDKETYLKLKEQIIKDMTERPYVDEKGRTWPYGEFMPYDLSFFDYNESYASQYFPLSKEEALQKGFRWRDVPKSSHETTLAVADLPDSINDAEDNITKEIIACEECGLAYKILPEELAMLRRFVLPIPRSCHTCRHMKRLKKIGGPELYVRNCMCDSTEHVNHTGKACDASFHTSYAPGSPEIVYCESCYQKEIL